MLKQEAMVSQIKRINLSYKINNALDLFKNENFIFNCYFDSCLNYSYFHCWIYF